MFNRHVLKKEWGKERERKSAWVWVDRHLQGCLSIQEPWQCEMLPWALIFQNPLQVADVFPLSSNSSFISHSKLYDYKKKNLKKLCAKIFFFHLMRTERIDLKLYLYYLLNTYTRLLSPFSFSKVAETNLFSSPVELTFRRQDFLWGFCTKHKEVCDRNGSALDWSSEKLTQSPVSSWNSPW